MEAALILLVVLTITGTVVYAVIRVLVGAFANKHKEGEALHRREAIIGGLFDGREVVTYQAGRGALPANLVIEASAAHGYELTSQSVNGNTNLLVFTKLNR